MEFRKTTVLPQGDAAEANRLLREMIFDRPDVLLVVVGEGAASERLVSRAGQLAGDDGEPRWVVWARALDDIRPTVETLNGPAAAKSSVLSGAAQAFSVSFANAIADAIKSGSEPDNVRVEQAYARAEAAA